MDHILTSGFCPRGASLGWDLHMKPCCLWFGCPAAPGKMWVGWCSEAPALSTSCAKHRPREFAWRFPWSLLSRSSLLLAPSWR